MTVPGSLRARYQFKGSAAPAGFRGWLGSVGNVFWRLRVSSVQQVAVLVSLLVTVTAVVGVIAPSTAPVRIYISVKREGSPDAPGAPPGLASNYLHDQGIPGTVVRVSAPAGDFFLHAQDDRPLVLLSGGVGLTPMLSMLDTIVARGVQQETWFVHAALSGRHHAMKQHVQDVVAAHDAVRAAVFYEFPTQEDVRGLDYDEPGRITMEWLKSTVPVPGADYYFCGPKGFMRMLAIGLRALDVPDERIHFEFFGPAEALYA